MQCSLFWRSSGPLGTQITLNRQNLKWLSSLKCVSFSFWLSKQYYCDAQSKRAHNCCCEETKHTCLGSCWSGGRLCLSTAALQRGCVSLTCLQKHTLRSEENVRVAPDSCRWGGGRKLTRRHSARLGSARHLQVYWTTLPLKSLDKSSHAFLFIYFCNF